MHAHSLYIPEIVHTHALTHTLTHTRTNKSPLKDVTARVVFILSLMLTWPIHMCVPWRIHACGTTHSCVWPDSTICVWHDSFMYTCVYICTLCWCATALHNMGHESLKCAAALYYETCNIHEWVMSHTWKSHVTRDHVTHMNESCHTHKWVMSHT